MPILIIVPQQTHVKTLSIHWISIKSNWNSGPEQEDDLQRELFAAVFVLLDDEQVLYSQDTIGGKCLHSSDLPRVRIINFLKAEKLYPTHRVQLVG